jgi:hypothetical protein
MMRFGGSRQPYRMAAMVGYAHDAAQETGTCGNGTPRTGAGRGVRVEERPTCLTLPLTKVSKPPSAAVLI